jgi:rubrerythrin
MSLTEEQLAAFFKEQVKREKAIVLSVKKALKDIKNPVVEAVLMGISYDSSKHAQLYKSAGQIIAVAPAIKEEKFEQIKKVVKWHIEMEEKLIGLLTEAINKTANKRVKFLLESILADEKRHHELLKSILEIIVKGETITDQDWWDIMWKYTPFHGAPGG